MEELGERPFCRTLERQKQDEEEAKKRKLEEEEEVRESKRAKVIPTVKGVEASDYIISPFKESESEDYNEKLKSQFKELLRSQEIVIQQQEKALLEQRQTINQQSCMIQDQQGRQSSNRAQEVYFPVHLSGLEELVPSIISSNPML